MKMFFVYFIFIFPSLLVSFVSSQALAGANRCLEAIHQVSNDRDTLFTYGLESEINVYENPRIVEFYRLVNVPEADWLELSRTRRIELAKEQEKENRYRYHKPLYVRLKSQNLTGLPLKLETEGNGNVEVNGDIFDRFSEFQNRRKNLDELLGRGSLQGHLTIEKMGEISPKGSTGYTVFSADFAQLQSLEVTFLKFYQNPGAVIPGKNLANYSLGPLSIKDVNLYRENERRALNNKRLFPLGSSRLIYGPVMREDPYPNGYIGWEMRQFHKRGDALETHLIGLRNILLHNKSLEPFKKFEDVETIHEGLIQQRMKEYGFKLRVTRWLEHFRKIRKLTASDPDFNLFEYKDGGGAPVYWRFLYPLRPWKSHPLLKELDRTEQSAVFSRIDSATQNYIFNLNKLIVRGDKKDLTQDDLLELQVLVSQWAFESGISHFFQRYWDQQVTIAREGTVNSSPRIPNGISFEKSLKVLGDTVESGVLRAKVEWNHNPYYQEVRDSTVEIIIRHLGHLGYDYDHARLRVGDRIYEFTINEGSTGEPLAIALDFEVKNGERTGFLFYVGKEKINEYQKIMEKAVEAENVDQLPPFTVVDPEAKTLFSTKDTVSIDGKTYPLVKIGSSSFAKAQNGFLWPIVRQGLRYVTQAVSCSSSIIYFLNNYFGIKIIMEYGYEADAMAVNDHLEAGNPRGTPVKAVIKYHDSEKEW